MSPVTKRAAAKRATNKKSREAFLAKPTAAASEPKKKQINVTDTYTSNGVELEISTVEKNNSVEVIGSRVRPSSGAEWIYVDPGRLSDLATVLIEAGYPKL